MYTERRLSPHLTVWRSVGGHAATIPADGSVDVILHDDRLTVAGPSTRSIQTRADNADGFVGVRWAPGAAASALRLPLAELRDLEAPLDGLLPPAAVRRMAAMIRSAVTAGAPAEMGDLDVDPAPWVTAVRSAAGDGLRASAAATAVFCSERELRRRMTAEFGYGYHSLVQVLRAQRAYPMVVSGVALADVAVRAGYADQSHLTREFRRRVGATPGQLASSSA